MIITQLISKFLNFLYGPLAYVYDVVSWIVSFGQWNEWTKLLIPYIQGKNILELGFGTGHLLKYLQMNGYHVIGIDTSRQMIKITNKRLMSQLNFRKDLQNQSLIRADAVKIPLQSRSIDTIISTFPASFILQKQTLIEIRRVLTEQGRLLVLLAAFPRADSIISKALALLYRVTGETSASKNQIETFVREKFLEVGITASVVWLPGTFSDLLLINA